MVLTRNALDWSLVSEQRQAQYEQLLYKMVEKQPNDITTLALAGEQLTSFNKYDPSPSDLNRFHRGFSYLENAAKMAPQDDEIAGKYCGKLEHGRRLEVLTNQETIASALDLLSRDLPATRLCAAKTGLEISLQAEDWSAAATFAEPLLESSENDDQLLATSAKGVLALKDGDVELASNMLLACARMAESPFSRPWPRKTRPEWELARKLNTHGYRAVVDEYRKRYQENDSRRDLPSLGGEAVARALIDTTKTTQGTAIRAD